MSRDGRSPKDVVIRFTHRMSIDVLMHVGPETGQDAAVQCPMVGWTMPAGNQYEDGGLVVVACSVALRVLGFAIACRRALGRS